MKRKLIKGSNRIQFTFDGLEPIVFDPEKVSATNRAYAETHGWMARIGDTAALSRKDKDGIVRTITETDRRAEIERAVAHYESGSAEWELGRVAAQNPMILGLAAKWECTYAEAMTRFASIDLAEIAKLA